jgi:hypothetical protein
MALTACAPIGPSAVVTGDAASLSHASLAPTQIASLGNLSKNEVLARLGQPNFTRHDPPAEIWQYRGASCVLDLFLYPENGGDLRVAHAVSRDPHSAQAATDSCSPFAMPKQTAANS